MDKIFFLTDNRDRITASHWKDDNVWKLIKPSKVGKTLMCNGMMLTMRYKIMKIWDNSN